ncbi:6-bisphosphatase or related enzyme [Commensalibacter communis]|uniref:inositol monophosphatase family protein n=1 Tax=Commensalibacter communis TaxID=2972786 RepID=UPI0022FF60B1|nr:inositol monophosphatase family protein [Commensalibacter communis]CAI3953102.1 6-bisphosphatase or related enzyme [Commensalibacter communis]CAI3960618.1 6-bisphosphatase or related enzyme [Commensalibacter communis]
MNIDTKIKQRMRFDPVTNVDRETELLLRNKIQEVYPTRAITGEEWGRLADNSPFEWIIDPIDGTRPFLCGLPVWGCLIGLLYEGKAVMGMMSQPYTGDRFWSDGQIVVLWVFRNHENEDKTRSYASSSYFTCNCSKIC